MPSSPRRLSRWLDVLDTAFTQLFHDGCQQTSVLTYRHCALFATAHQQYPFGRNVGQVVQCQGFVSGSLHLETTNELHELTAAGIVEGSSGRGQSPRLVNADHDAGCSLLIRGDLVYAEIH
jgi:hypothetical protein